jgi:radical SAM superfamily enzyme YgiQ (UPF0313 family)
LSNSASIRFCLVSPPTVYDVQSRQLSPSRAARIIGENPPLGILSLAAVLENHGSEPVVVDLNREMCRFVADPASQAVDFASCAASALADTDCDVYGFGSISASYPLTLRIVRELKRRCPERPVILGGPQASATDRSTLDGFPEVDVVVRGEAEEIILNLATALGCDGGLEAVAGISFRRTGTAVRNRPGPAILDLDSLPLPAYHLHPEVQFARWVSIELGRGCPFGCKFCATNDFFRRKYRLKSPAAVLRQMHQMCEQYGIREFDLIHDMFTVDCKGVTAFCETLMEAGSPYRWFCSARTDSVDEKLLRLMSEAGCASVFFGVETGSARMQKIIDKHLDLDEARGAVSLADRYGMYAAVSLIIGFPEETADDIRQTANLFVSSSRIPRAEPLIYLLVPLAETPVHARYRQQLAFDPTAALIFDQNWDQSPEDRSLIARHPDVFSCFYELPLQYDRGELNELHFFLRYGCARFKWLLIALLEETGDILGVFENWLRWRNSLRRPSLLNERDWLHYYSGMPFFSDLLDYLDQVYLPGVPSTQVAVRSMTQYSRDLLAGRKGSRGEILEQTPSDLVAAVPVLSPDVVVFDSDVDAAAVINALETGRHPITLETRRRTFATQQFEREPAKLIELSPLAAALLGRCDGETTVSAGIRATRRARASKAPDAPAIHECVETLVALRDCGLIQFLADRSQAAG